MRTLQELLRRLVCYDMYFYIYEENRGYLCWHFSTGDNIEMLFLEVEESQRGNGVAADLYREFCRRVIDQRTIAPYYSVFAFRKTENESAGKLYKKMGFEQIVVPGLYAGGDATLMWIPFKTLCHNLGVI